MVPSLPLLSCESSVSVKENPDRKKEYIETSPLICSANQWTGSYIIGTSVMEELIKFSPKCLGQ